MKKKILISLLILLIILLISISAFIFFDNSIKKYDEDKIYEISKSLYVYSMYYEGMQENIKTVGNNINISDIDNIEINKQIASYVINNIEANTEYGYNDCNECYKYFSKDDNIRFYDVLEIERIYNNLFNDQLVRITQEDIIGFNIIYYNESIDKYYINVALNSYKPEIISEFKGYSYEDNKLYFDYYYSNIVYDENISESNDIKEKIYLYNMNDIMVHELFYDDLFNKDNILTEYGDYINYFDVVRYVFEFDYVSKKYIFNAVKLLGN